MDPHSESSGFLAGLTVATLGVILWVITSIVKGDWLLPTEIVRDGVQFLEVLVVIGFGMIVGGPAWYWVARPLYRYLQ